MSLTPTLFCSSWYHMGNSVLRPVATWNLESCKTDYLEINLRNTKAEMPLSSWQEKGGGPAIPPSPPQFWSAAPTLVKDYPTLTVRPGCLGPTPSSSLPWLTGRGLQARSGKGFLWQQARDRAKGPTFSLPFVAGNGESQYWPMPTCHGVRGGGQPRLVMEVQAKSCLF